MSSFAAEGWDRVWSEADQAYYYHEPESGSVTWENPKKRDAEV